MLNATSHAATVLLVLCLSLFACSPRPSIEQTQILAFGTLIDITMVHADRERLKRAEQMLQADFQRMHRDWHAWKPSQLTAINRACVSGETVPVTPELATMLNNARQISRLTDYRFNPAIGKLIALWGFQSSDPKANPVKTQAAIEALIAAHPSLDDLVIKNGQLQCHNPAVKIDLGGYAKGYGLGIEAKKLKSMGIENFILNAGGDLVAYGHAPGRAWRIGIRDPNGARALATVLPHDGEGVFTSGDYERYYEENGQRRHHIIDPRTGEPTHGARAVTVIHNDPGLADAAATALMIAGAKDFIAVCQRLGIEYVLLMDEAGKLHASQKMLERLQLNVPELPIRAYPL